MHNTAVIYSVIHSISFFRIYQNSYFYCYILLGYFRRPDPPLIVLAILYGGNVVLCADLNTFRQKDIFFPLNLS